MKSRLLDATGQFPSTRTCGLISSFDREGVWELFGPQVVALASATWPASNRAIFIPICISQPVIVSNIGWQNGSVASGNVDGGVYATDGTRLVSTGSTAQSGTSVPQTASCTATVLQPGVYFMALAMDNTTGTMARAANPSSLLVYEVFGIQQAATSFVLPSTATFANPATAYIPQMYLLVHGAI